MNTTKACPACAFLTELPVCPRHGKNMSIPTLTLTQLRARRRRYAGSVALIDKAIKALEGVGA